MANDNPIPSFLMPAIIKAYKNRKKLEAQMSQLPNATALTGSPDKHPNEITAEEKNPHDGRHIHSRQNSASAHVVGRMQADASTSTLKEMRLDYNRLFGRDL